MRIAPVIKQKKTLSLFIFLLSSFFLLLSTISNASAAVLYFYPQYVSIAPGEEALFELRLDTEGEPINAIELDGKLSGVAATLRTLDNSGSALSIFVERPSIEGRSAFRLVGGAPSGIVGEHILARVSVRGELPGASRLSYVPETTAVLLADGAGGSASVRFLGADIAVEKTSPDKLILTSESHPDQNQWYSSAVAHIRFNWDESGRYSYTVTRDMLGVPDDEADLPVGSSTWDGGVKIHDLPEGISYFAIKKIGSEAISRYRVMTDYSKPRWLEIRKSAGTGETEGRPFLSFLAHDDVSGIEYYEVRVNHGEPFTVSSPYPFPDSYSVISLRAYDRAGNYIEEYIPGPQKDYTLWVWTLILFVLLVWVSGIIDTGKKRS